MVREKPRMSDGDYAEKMERKGLTPDGAMLDAPDMDLPIAPPLGYIKQPSITERIRDMVRSEHLRLAAESAGAETFEEANDFDVGDDYDPSSPYEEVFDPPAPVISTPDPAAPIVESTGVPIPPVGGTGEGAEGGIPAASAADKPAAAPARAPASPPRKAPPGPT